MQTSAVGIFRIKIILAVSMVAVAILAGLHWFFEAQAPTKQVRIGRLSPQTAEADAPLLDAFRTGLRELGWIEGKHYTIEARFADGKFALLPMLASELAGSGVDVILAGSVFGVSAARKATQSIPIVMVATGDPVASGLIDSLSRPGANVTGLTALGEDLMAKRLELLKEFAPSATRVAVLTSRAPAAWGKSMPGSREASERLKLQLQRVEAQGPADLDQVFDEMARERAEALLVTDAPLRTHRKQVVELAAVNRLPAIYDEREFIDAGGLMFYGANLPELYRRAATQVDRITKGEKPATMAIELPTTFDLVINVKTANALGLTFPRTILLRATGRIE